MKQKLCSVLLILILCLSLACPAFAAGSRLTDDAGLLTADEAAEVNSKLNSISTQYQVDVLIMTVTNTEGLSADDFINFIFDSLYGKNHDGVLLVVDMGDRTYRILSNGLAADAISLDDIDSIGYQIESYLSDGDYAQAFLTYAEECEYYINGHINGFPYEFGTNLIIALVVGFVVALIVTGIMRAQLKSVRTRDTAGDYMKQGSLRITQSSDIFLYRNVTRQAKPKNNSGSGGSSSGGRNVGGGRF